MYLVEMTVQYVIIVKNWSRFKAFLDDRAVWCRLEDPRQLRGKSPHTSPRGSIAGTGKRNTFGDQRSVSDDVDSIGKPFINAILTGTIRNPQ